MPFACEDCGEMGARMNSMFEIRLCQACSTLPKYKLICKSKALNQYILTDTDLNSHQIPPEEYRVKNPHYRSGPPMTLYKQTEIEQVFLSKYNNLIVQLAIQDPDLPTQIPEQIAEVIKDYLREQKETKKQQKYYKILDKYNIREEQDLPDWVQDKLRETKSGAEYERVISGYLRFVKLHKLMKQEKLVKYIDHKICHNFIYQTDKTIKLEQIPSIIRFMLNKKNLISHAVKTYKINTSKYSREISQYINSFEPEPQEKSISNDLDTLIEYINRKEDMDKQRDLRTKELREKLKLRGLELRSDSVLCSNYIGGSGEYTCDELVDIMEQMNWFFTKTNYSTYSKQYDNERYEARKSSYYDYGETRHYYSSRKYYYDSDSDDSDDSDYYESREREKQEYNKRKSEYVKKRCLKEWIGNGKRGTYPQCLIPLIEQVEKEMEKEMEKEKNQPKQQKQKKILNTSKTNPCSNPSCLNIHSLACANKMCRICCNGVGCEIHKKSIKSVKST